MLHTTYFLITEFNSCRLWCANSENINKKGESPLNSLHLNKYLRKLYKKDMQDFKFVVSMIRREQTIICTIIIVVAKIFLDATLKIRTSLCIPTVV